MPVSRKVDRPPIAPVDSGQEVHHRVDLVRIFRKRKCRDLGFESLEPGRADRQIHSFSLDFGRLGYRPLNLTELGVDRLHPEPRPLALQEAIPDRSADARHFDDNFASSILLAHRNDRSGFKQNFLKTITPRSR